MTIPFKLDGRSEMDMEVVGRHALLFDDDNNASFVNSPDALVEWNSLFIDRYDVRHLLPNPMPPRTRRRHLTRSSSSPPPYHDASLESELDEERYLDLPLPSEEQEQEQGKEPEQAEAGRYHSVGFSYGNLDEFTVQKNNDPEPVFHPAFPVPDILSQNLVSIPLVFLICQCKISHDLDIIVCLIVNKCGQMIIARVHVFF